MGFRLLSDSKRRVKAVKPCCGQHNNKANKVHVHNYEFELLVSSPTALRVA